MISSQFVLSTNENHFTSVSQKSALLSGGGWKEYAKQLVPLYEEKLEALANCEVKQQVINVSNDVFQYMIWQM